MYLELFTLATMRRPDLPQSVNFHWLLVHSLSAVPPARLSLTDSLFGQGLVGVRRLLKALQ